MADDVQNMDDGAGSANTSAEQRLDNLLKKREKVLTGPHAAESI